MTPTSPYWDQTRSKTIFAMTPHASVTDYLPSYAFMFANVHDCTNDAWKTWSEIARRAVIRATSSAQLTPRVNAISVFK
eukprot:1159884-Pelagomonas_calceolata.AAC.6